MANKRADIVIPTNIDPQTRMVFVQLLARVKQLEEEAATIDFLVQKGVLKREGGRISAVVTPAK